MTGLDVPLSPLRFLERASEIYPSSVAIVDGDRRLTYSEFAAAAQRLARGLIASGVRRGERVAFMSANSAELLIAHFGVPLAGAVLVAVNTRLSGDEVVWICSHSQARILFGDADLLVAVEAADDGPELVIELPAQNGEYTGERTTYAELSARGGSDLLPWQVSDESSTISINYTSGTTGRPKGVMYTHRGAYLASLNAVVHQRLVAESRYLWTLPMFHCNGWCMTWAVTAAAGRHIALRQVRGPEIWRLIDDEGISHLGGAPVVLNSLSDASQAHPIAGSLTVSTGGAPPGPSVRRKIVELGADLVHLYGLTETYGPHAACEMRSDWLRLAVDEQDKMLSRQGVGMVAAESLRVVRRNQSDIQDVEPDGTEVGEIVMRGNMVMKGYLNDQAATEECFAGGWFHSGDLGVMHSDGYIQLVDRAKDVVISGGENISTIEVEQALDAHDAVADVVVIGVPDDEWGERPKAFVVRTDGFEVTEAELIAHVKSKIASFKAPRNIEFVAELPRTSTGKVCKNDLRDLEWAGSGSRIRG
ncbi:acyl-CoA synthetase [Rhodococcus sp. WS4]|nr:acyl-CoA synthetase [Rhodococcus sp. WS4]